MSTKLQRIETIESLFTMTGGNAKLLDRAISGCTARLDSVHLLKSVEDIIERRKNRTHPCSSLERFVDV
jgi:hypothetical protein